MLHPSGLASTTLKISKLLVVKHSAMNSCHTIWFPIIFAQTLNFLLLIPENLTVRVLNMLEITDS